MQKTDFYKQFVHPGDLVFDVGANVGERTELFRNLGAKVVAVEPHPDCAYELMRKFVDDPQVSLCPWALGPDLGTGLLITGPATQMSSLSADWVRAVLRTGRFDEYEWNKQISVPVNTLDNLIADFGIPDFIKIDVEGYEAEVLEGFNKRVPLSFEFTPEYFDATSACLDRLDGLGYKKFAISYYETMELGHWMDLSDFMLFRNLMPDDNKLYGDIYAR